MAGATARRTAIASIVTVLAASALPAPVARGAEPLETVALPGSAVSAVTADLDGDGAREVIRLSIDGALEVWTFRGEGWELTGSATVLSEPEPDVAAEGPDVVALFAMRAAGNDRVMLATGSIGPAVAGPSAGCCLELAEVRADGSDVELVTRWSGEWGADVIRAADLDGDGTDELVTEVTSYTDDPEEWAHDVAILRWDGDRLVSIFQERSPDETFAVMVAETDGVAGEDVVIGPGSSGEMRRVRVSNGAAEVERTELAAAGGVAEAWPVGAADGTVIVQTPDGLVLVEWPAGDDPVVARRVDGVVPYVHALLGTGPDAVILTDGVAGIDGVNLPQTAVHALDGRMLGEVAPASLSEAARDVVRDASTGVLALQTTFYPYFGRFPGGIDGRDAYVVGGTLVQPGGSDGFETRAISPMIGRNPLGAAGPGDAWMLTTNGFYGPGPSQGTYLFPYGGQPEGFGVLTLVPMTELLAPEPATAVAIEPSGTVAVSEAATDAGEEELLAPGDGFSAVVTAPASSVALVRDGPIVDEHLMTGEPLVIEVRPRTNARPDRDVPFRRSIVVVLPSGHVIGVDWTGTFVREDPVLAATAATRMLAFSSTVSGTVEGAASVTVDGRPADLAPSGTFSVDVDAPIWPRDVVVIARDLLGNQATARLEVVGLVDYRGVPWVPVLGLATLAVGVLLFVRTPRLRGRATERWDDDVVLEDVE